MCGTPVWSNPSLTSKAKAAGTVSRAQCDGSPQVSLHFAYSRRPKNPLAYAMAIGPVGDAARATWPCRFAESTAAAVHAVSVPQSVAQVRYVTRGWKCVPD